MTEKKTRWQRTKNWVSDHRVVSGALAGGAAGSIVPGVGNVLGVIVGAGVGYMSADAAKNGKK